MTGTMWLGDGITGRPASVKQRFRVAARLLMARAFGLALFQVADCGERAGRDRRRQRRREYEPGGVAAHKIDERRRARDIAADHPEGLAESALDHRRAVHNPVAFGDPAAVCSVEPDRMHLVEIGHRAKAIGDVAQFADRGDVAVHRSGGVGRGCMTLKDCSTAIECDTTDRKLPQYDRSHKP
jgi:hypothetical protein